MAADPEAARALLAQACRDVVRQMGVQAVKEGRLLPSDNELLSPDAKGAFDDAVSKFWNSDQSVDDAIKSMAAALKR